MIIFTENKILKTSPTDALRGPAIILASIDERDAALALTGITVISGFPDAENNSTRFESRELYDYVTIHIPDFVRLDEESARIEGYITKTFLVLVGDSPIIAKLEYDLSADLGVASTPACVLAMLFNLLLGQEMHLLESIDDDIENLEELATLKKPEDQTQTIITLRKQLLALKRYFEALYDLLEELEDNLNNHFSTSQLQIFRAHKNKVNRLLNKALSLRDYLTQVREAFQMQLDIGLNETMRIFTVITAVFLPLTLIVGWYGMNLRMPEMKSAITYPIVIGVSAVFVIFSLIYSKRKGWF